jgi:hypothetical protein
LNKLYDMTTCSTIPSYASFVELQSSHNHQYVDITFSKYPIQTLSCAYSITPSVVLYPKLDLLTPFLTAPTTTAIVNPAPSSSAQSAPIQSPQSSQGSPSSASNSPGPANSPTSRASSPTTSQGPVTSPSFLAPSPTSGETQVSASVEGSSSSLVVSSPASSLTSQQTRESTSAEDPSSSQVGSSTRAVSTSQRPQASSNTVSSRPNSPTDSSSNNPSPTPTGGNSNPTETPNEDVPSVTQQVVYKTTLPNGAVTTVTAITVVPAAGDVTRGNPATRTSAGNAGLQTGAATRERSGINVALLGALGMAAAAAL